eukprot:scaffold218278_cov24-Tisochrysis_lutea.AAC.1
MDAQTGQRPVLKPKAHKSQAPASSCTRTVASTLIYCPYTSTGNAILYRLTLLPQISRACAPYTPSL